MAVQTLQSSRLEQLAAASPTRMVVILYEEAIESIEAAIDAIDNGEIMDRYTQSTRAMEIIAHLHDCLDMEQGGAVAANLSQVYRIVLARLTLVNPMNDRGAAAEAAELLKPLLDSWRKLDADPEGYEIALSAEASAAMQSSRNAPAAQVVS